MSHKREKKKNQPREGKTKFSFFVKDRKSVTLVPLTPKQVYEDQLKLKSEFEQKNKSEAEISKKKKREEKYSGGIK